MDLVVVVLEGGGVLGLEVLGGFGKDAETKEKLPLFQWPPSTVLRHQLLGGGGEHHTLTTLTPSHLDREARMQPVGLRGVAVSEQDPKHPGGHVHVDTQPVQNEVHNVLRKREREKVSTRAERTV